jgi:uncharacterized membrane protein
MNRIRILFEHQLQNLGLYTGIAFGMFLFPILWGIDFKFLSTHLFLQTDDYNKLTGINTTLSSLLIGILLTTYSVVFVVMQLASSQFSPRILRYFMYSDVKIQQFIGIYLGAIALIFLTQIVNVFTPNLKLYACTLFSILLNFYCLLILFPKIIIHLSDNMNVSSLTNRIKNEIVTEIQMLYVENWQMGDRLLYKRVRRNLDKAHLSIFWKGDSGYLSTIDYSQLSTLYNQFLQDKPNLVPSKIYQKAIIGEFIMCAATPIFVVELEPTVSEETKADVTQIVTKMLNEVVVINKYRSNTQDVNFGIRKLVDIAIKAISPAVNDPTTCLNCIDYLGEVIQLLAVKKFPSTQANQLSNERIFINEFGFDEVVDFSFDQIYQWGKLDQVVIKRILKTLQQILSSVLNPYHLMVLIREIEDMELEKIYTTTAPSQTHTLEQIRSIERELKKFSKLALEQIAVLEKKGILDGYAQNPKTANAVLQEEVNCIAYLKNYQIRNEFKSFGAA